MRTASQPGFTLFEVLVALAVMGFAMAGLWQGLGQSVLIADALPDRVTARWVAQNRLVIRQARSEWPQTKDYSGVMKMDGREWHWQEQVRPTQDPLLRKLTVIVRTGKKSAPLYSIEGYLRRPRPVRKPRASAATTASELSPATRGSDSSAT